MTKFFLQSSNTQTPKKNSKQKDYRFIIFSDLLKCIKAFNLHQINKTIRKIKSLKEKQSQEKIINEIKELEKQLLVWKSIKNKDAKILSLYIMKNVLNIGNFEIFDNTFAKFHGLKIKQIDFEGEVDNKVALNHLHHQIASSQMYQKEIQKAGLFCDIVSRKKHLKKEKSKQRKSRKIQLKKNPQLEKQNKLGQSKDESEIIQQEQTKKPAKKGNFKNLQNRSSESNKKKYESAKQFVQSIEVKKQRTQFKKVGRNKALEKKKLKKQKYIKKENNYQKSTIKTKIFESREEKKPQPMHPSWQAKKQANNQMFIQGFQGKRTLL